MRDLPVVLARGGSGATTVAATSFIADHAGIRVFATGGLGGVHRGAEHTFDESADLKVLSEVPITVVSAGVKSILDIAATLERMETLGIVVLGYGTADFPSFWLRSSGHPLDWSVPDAAQWPPSWSRARSSGSARPSSWPTRCRSTSSSTPAGTTPCSRRRCVERRRRASSARTSPRSCSSRSSSSPAARASRSTSASPRTTSASPPRSPRLVAVVTVAGAASSWSATSSTTSACACSTTSPRRSDTNAEIRLRPGGSAGNVAAWLGHLGVDVVFCGRVGADAVDRHVRALAEHGVDAHVAGDPGTTATIVLQLDREGRAHDVRRPRRQPWARRRRRAAEAWRRHHLAAPHRLHVLRPGHPAGGDRSARRGAPARVAGQRRPELAGVPAARPAAEDFLGWIDGADLVFPNIDEARVLVGATGPQIDLDALAARFPHVVVTLGSMGAAYLGGSRARPDHGAADRRRRHDRRRRRLRRRLPRPMDRRRHARGGARRRSRRGRDLRGPPRRPPSPRTLPRVAQIRHVYAPKATNLRHSRFGLRHSAAHGLIGAGQGRCCSAATPDWGVSP